MVSQEALRYPSQPVLEMLIRVLKLSQISNFWVEREKDVRHKAPFRHRQDGKEKSMNYFAVINTSLEP